MLNYLYKANLYTKQIRQAIFRCPNSYFIPMDFKTIGFTSGLVKNSAAKISGFSGFSSNNERIKYDTNAFSSG